MKRFCAGLAIAALSFALPQYSHAQRMCGIGYQLSQLNAKDPAKMQMLREQHNKMAIAAAANLNAQAKTTALSAIPLVFHFVLDSNRYKLLGSDTGIKRRVNSQIAALNRDFNATNADRSLVPVPWKSLIGDAGVSFGLANASSANTITPGIELRIMTSLPNYDVNNSCADVKHETGGLQAWDNTKYLNIWVTNIGSTSNLILGVTVPPSFVSQWSFPADELGIVLNYGAMGAREFPTQFFFSNTDLGRTLTHEMGHYFELWHIWGDDNGLCPDNGGQDDGIADTPPQADQTYCNSGTCPTYPKYDACSPTGNGIMFMNYMDYTDDASMYLFTAGQVSMMRAQFAVFGGESYPLTQQPGAVGVDNIAGAAVAAVSISPNPTTGVSHLTLEQTEGFHGAQVINMTGQTIAHIDARPGAKQYDLDLSGAPKGFYIIQCRYEGGTVTKKLVLE